MASLSDCSMRFASGVQFYPQHQPPGALICLVKISGGLTAFFHASVERGLMKGEYRTMSSTQSLDTFPGSPG